MLETNLETLEALEARSRVHPRQKTMGLQVNDIVASLEVKRSKLRCSQPGKLIRGVEVGIRGIQSIDDAKLVHTGKYRYERGDYTFGEPAIDETEGFDSLEVGELGKEHCHLAILPPRLDYPYEFYGAEFLQLPRKNDWEPKHPGARVEDVTPARTSEGDRWVGF